MPNHWSSRSILTFGHRQNAGLSKAAAAVVIVIVLAAAGVGAIFATTQTPTQTVTQIVTQSAIVTTTVTSLQTTTVTTTVTSQQTPTANNTIDLRGNSRVVLAVVGPGGKVEFVIGTLKNPTIQVKAGTRLEIFFESGILQGRVAHSFVITSAKPPFPSTLSPSDVTPAFPGASTDDPLDPQKGEFQLFFMADKPGTYYYICGSIGHAADPDSMYGQFIVEE